MNKNYQNVAWLWDIHNRKLLNLNPPYQRRAVWNQEYMEYFVDTILNNYPTPAIFLHQEIDPEGRMLYHVVDGKQRLTTLFKFLANEFPTSENPKLTTVVAYRGRYFRDLDAVARTAFFTYQFSIEYLETTDEQIIGNIFDRINRNVAKLSPQELRHARFDGVFIGAAEELTLSMLSTLPKNAPRITQKSRDQMKDVEFTTHLLLFLESYDAKSYDQEGLDEIYALRDLEWEHRDRVKNEFQIVIKLLASLFEAEGELTGTRLVNQTDFYSLFCAVAEVLRDRTHILAQDPTKIAAKLLDFAHRVDEESERARDDELRQYYEAARSASTHASSRQTRIRHIRKVLES